MVNSSFGNNENSAIARKCAWAVRSRYNRVSLYFHHPSQGTSTNHYLILGLRDKAAPSTSQQINKFRPKRVKNLATPSSIFSFFFSSSSSSTGELCSQPVRGNDRRIGRMFPEHVEQSFLYPEYSFDEYFQLGSRGNIRPIKNGLYVRYKCWVSVPLFHNCSGTGLSMQITCLILCIFVRCCCALYSCVIVNALDSWEMGRHQLNKVRLGFLFSSSSSGQEKKNVANLLLHSW